MKKVCIIPARMGSSRFPGKPLVKVLSLPLIIHVAKRCDLLKDLDYVAVATCDVEIKEACEVLGISVVMTSNQHERCTDRVSEAIENSGLSFSDDDLIIMVQGDEVLVSPEMINNIILDYEKNKTPVINLLSRIYREEDHQDPNVVKVVSSPQQRALYFSRSPIPSTYRDKNALIYQQTGIIGFSRQFLREFSGLSQTPLEKVESIDMLRVLEHDLPLRVVYTEQETVAIDVPYDLERAEAILQNDDLYKLYA